MIRGQLSVVPAIAFALLLVTGCAGDTKTAEEYPRRFDEKFGEYYKIIKKSFDENKVNFELHVQSKPLPVTPHFEGKILVFNLRDGIDDPSNLSVDKKYTEIVFGLQPYWGEFKTGALRRSAQNIGEVRYLAVTESIGSGTSQRMVYIRGENRGKVFDLHQSIDKCLTIIDVENGKIISRIRFTFNPEDDSSRGDAIETSMYNYLLKYDK